jgi:hypothetical protein
VARVGASFGRARVYVDGALAATVDLAQPASSRRIVFAKTWASSSTHTLRVVNLATHGRPTIDVDAFVVVR